MTDRELIGYAAKAMGFEHVYNPMGKSVIHDGECQRYWNPLKDDGDALRLAVDLYMNIEYKNDGRVYVQRGGDGGCAYIAIGSSREDRLANTRRAIVEIAALIGKDTEKNNG